MWLESRVPISVREVEDIVSEYVGKIDRSEKLKITYMPILKVERLE